VALGRRADVHDFGTRSRVAVAAELVGVVSGAPLVTIAVPTFNRATALGRCLASARDQSYPAIEIVVCDNASTDDTEAVVAGTLDGHPRARYLRHDTNLGALANFRVGLDEANGDYFMWLADDDWLAPDYVERCVEALRDDSRAVLANGDAVYTGDGRPAVTEPGVSLTQSSPARRVLGYYTWVGRNAAFYGLSTVAARRDATWDEELGSDWVHIAELAAAGTIRRVPSTIHRSTAGETARFDRRLQHFARPIARLVADDIRTHPSFAPLGTTKCTALALACASVIYWRKGVLYWRELLAHRVRGTHVPRAADAAPVGSAG
jgi:glycosyltransferase involved in cell wall biosynthesis